MVLRARLQAVRRVLGGGLELRNVESLEDGLPAPQHPDVRPVELVGRAGEEVGAERRHVHEGVGRVVDGVHEDEGASRVREARVERGYDTSIAGLRGANAQIGCAQL